MFHKMLRSKWFKTLFVLCLAVGSIHLASAIFWDTRLEYKEITLASAKVTPQTAGYRIAFITDIHGTSPEKLQEMVHRVNALEVDLVLLGGDYSGQRDLSRCFSILAGIKAKDGFYGVEGNHDNAKALAAAMEQSSMVLLENEGAEVAPGLYIAGLEDLWNRKPNANAALASAPPEDIKILLAHNPDTAMRYNCSQADLVLSGHTHGGEVALFGIYAPAVSGVSNYGHKLRTGWCTAANNAAVYVSNGVGSHVFRVFVRPQVIIITLENA